MSKARQAERWVEVKNLPAFIMSAAS